MAISLSNPAYSAEGTAAGNLFESSVCRLLGLPNPLARFRGWPGLGNQRYALGARRLAERMIDETAKETMLSVAEECDEFAVTAAIQHFDKLFVGRLIRETKGS